MIVYALEVSCPVHKGGEALAITKLSGVCAERLEMIPDDLVQHAGTRRPTSYSAEANDTAARTAWSLPNRAPQKLSRITARPRQAGRISNACAMQDCSFSNSLQSHERR